MDEGRDELGRLLITVSALQHYSYCPRQCALIHMEQTFDENVYTLRGRREHERVDRDERSVRDGVVSERALPIWSDELGLIGRADVVEFDFFDGVLCAPCPIEYKHGKRHKQIHDEIQLCAQALCLEEMFGEDVVIGYIYHVSSRRRRKVHLDHILREMTLSTIEAVRGMLETAKMPPAVYDAKCRNCSLHDSCMPRAVFAMRK